MRRMTSIAVVVMVVCGCSSPMSPSGPTPVQVAGVWAQTATVTASSGGECLTADFQNTIGEGIHRSLTVAQNGSSLTATYVSATTNDRCSWTGTAGSNTMSLNFVSCNSNSEFLGLRCHDASGVRDVRLVSDVITATVAGNTATGTETYSFNILVAGTQDLVGTWTQTWSTSMTR